MKRDTFTLIELLMVCAMIGMLCSLLLPSLKKARAVSERTVCASNLKQLYMGSMLHAKQNDYILPPVADGGKSWIYPVSIALDVDVNERPVRAESEVFACPTVKPSSINNNSYSYNKWCGFSARSSPQHDPVSLVKVSKPSGAWYIADGRGGAYNGNFWGGDRSDKEHMGRTQGIVLDGSVMNLKKPQQNKLHPEWPGYWKDWAFYDGQ